MDKLHHRLGLSPQAFRTRRQLGHLLECSFALIPLRLMRLISLDRSLALIPDQRDLAAFFCCSGSWPQVGHFILKRLLGTVPAPAACSNLDAANNHPAQCGFTIAFRALVLNSDLFHYKARLAGMEGFL